MLGRESDPIIVDGVKDMHHATIPLKIDILFNTSLYFSLFT